MSRSFWRRGVVAFAFGCLVAGCLQRESSPESRRSGPTRNRVLLVGIDGASWRVMGPMMERGELPNLDGLADEGVRADLLSLDVMLSPAVWTSIATGKPPDQHGIHGFVVQHEDERVPVSSNMRRTKAFWNILSERGHTVNVVGWYVSWPAEAVNGNMVSDHLIPRDKSADFWPVSAEEEARLKGRTFPETLMEELVPLIPPRENSYFVFEVVDTARARIAEYLMKAYPAEVTAVYFWGLDPIQHMSWKYFEPSSGTPEPLAPERARAKRDAIPNYAKRLDAFLGTLLEQIDDETTVLVVSDHGFGPAESPKEFGGGALSGDHRKEGILLMKGPGVRQGARLPTASVLDVTPTLLYILGLPVAKDMSGRIVREAFETSYLESHPRHYLESYDDDVHGPSAPLPSPLDPGILQNLEDLGYLH